MSTPFSLKYQTNIGSSKRIENQTWMFAAQCYNHYAVSMPTIRVLLCYLSAHNIGLKKLFKSDIFHHFVNMISLNRLTHENNT